MAFEDLTEAQRRLLLSLVEELASGKYSHEFHAAATMGRGWFLLLSGIGGAPNKELEGLEETDLHALTGAGYISLISKKHGYSAALTAKAYEGFKYLAEQVTVKAVAGRGGVRTVSENQLAKIETTSKDLVEDLRQNYNLSRSQARTWFRWTLGVSVLGFTLLAAGIVLAFTGYSNLAAANSIGGIVTEFLAVVFFRQAGAANDRQDHYHRDLVRRQQILDAVQLARLIANADDRDRVTESIIRQLLGLTAPANTPLQPTSGAAASS